MNRVSIVKLYFIEMYVCFHFLSVRYVISFRKFYSLSSVILGKFPLANQTSAASMVWPLVPKLAGSDFSGEKFLSSPSLGGEVKPSVPCRKITECKITQK